MQNLFHDIEQAITRSVPKDYRNAWQKIEIDHESETYDHSLLKRLNQEIGSPYSMGLYIYEYDVPQIDHPVTLYVGKSKTLPSRLYNHYKERHGLTGTPTWRRFWESHLHKMKVYVYEVGHKGSALEDEACRIISERYFISALKPISELHSKSVK